MSESPAAARPPAKSHVRRWAIAGGGLVAAGFFGAIGAGIFGWGSDALDTRAPLTAHVDLVNTQCQSVVVDEATRSALAADAEPTIDWALEHGGGAWSDGGVRVSVQGRSDAAVVLQGFVVSEVVRSQVPADAVVVSRCDPPPRGGNGGVSPRYYTLDLDAESPVVVLAEGVDDGEVVEFPYQVSVAEPEVLYVSTGDSDEACDCRWRLGLEWVSGDDSGVLDLGVIDTFVAPEAAFYKWSDGQWVGPYDLGG